MSSEPPFIDFPDMQWYSPFAIILILLILLIVGPTVLVPAWFVRDVASRVPIWDPDRRWDGVRGFAVLGSIIYAFLAAPVLLFADGTQLDLALGHVVHRAVLTAFDFSSTTLVHHWLAGLLLTCVFALSLEHAAPHTARRAYRVLTATEQQILVERETERQRQERERERAEEAKKQRQAVAEENERKRQQAAREAAMRRAAQRTKTPPPSTSAAQPSAQGTPPKPLAQEEAARDQWLAEQARRNNTPPLAQPSPRPTTPKAPPKKREKRDKGDGSMDDLL